MPDWLSDLAPDYVTSPSLRCPNDTTGQAAWVPDPKLPCSYTYEFASTDTIFTPGTSTMGEWKAEQIKQFGDTVPVVRCFLYHRSGLMLNLSSGGRLYFSLSGWEVGPREEYVTTGTAAVQTDGTALVREDDAPPTTATSAATNPP